MDSRAGTPRLAVVVAGSVIDARAEKVALAAARDGWDVTLLGVARDEPVSSTLGPVTVERVPRRDAFRNAVVWQSQRGARARVTQFGFPTSRDFDAYRAAYQSWLTDEELRIAYGDGTATPLLRRAGNYLRRTAFRMRWNAYRWERERTPRGKPDPADWRRSRPTQVDIDLALLPVLVKLAPDVLIAGDLPAITAVAKAAARLRVRGHRVGWLYDAHEYVRDGSAGAPAALLAMQREFLPAADAVIAASPRVAEALRTEHTLRQDPIVVRDLPIQSMIDTESDPPSLRTYARVGDDTPLLVYAGGIPSERDLPTVVDALAELPECHLAIVAGDPLAKEYRQLLKAAATLGALNRVHVVPPVPPSLTPALLSSADLGVIGSRRTTDAELSSPGNLGEYLHGGVPVLAGDAAGLTEFLEATGVGREFRAGDVRSFAAAVRESLAARAETAARITDELRADLSWERQSGELMALVRRIAPRAPDGPAADFSWAVPENDDGYPISRTKRTWRYLTDTPVRLGIGPANFAGQGALFARAVCRQLPHVSAEVIMYQAKGQFGFPADLRVKASAMGRPDIQLDLMERILGRYTHLIADGFRPVFGGLHGLDIAADLPILKKTGVRVALLAHGTEVRDPAAHRERHEFSHYREHPDDALVQRLIVSTARNRRIAEQSGLPVFVTTPDLLDDLPDAVWAPLVVDVDLWQSDRPVMERARPVVLHAPSARWTKGTERILPTLTEMDERGLIELRLVEGLRWDEMRAMVRDADVVLEQFAVGAYGTLAVESMAAGRPVLAYLGESGTAAGLETPIINATPATVRTALEELLDDRDRAARIGAASAEYARKFHDGTMTANVLSNFLADPAQRSSTERLPSPRDMRSKAAGTPSSPIRSVIS